MPTRTYRRAWAAVLLLMLLMLGGCGDGDADSPGAVDQGAAGRRGPTSDAKPGRAAITDAEAARAEADRLLESVPAEMLWDRHKQQLVEQLLALGEPGFEACVAAMDDGRYLEASVAAAVLQQHGERGRDALFAALDSSHPPAQTAALQALREMGATDDPRALDPLLRGVDSPATHDELLRFGSDAVPGLIRIVEDGDDSRRVQAAVGLLEQIGDERAIEPLAKALDGSGLFVRHAIVDALSAFGPKAIDAVAPLLESASLRDEAARVLGETGDPRAVAILIEHLAQGTRHGAVKALAKLGPVAIDPLIEALDHENARVAAQAARALAHIEDPRVVAPILRHGKTAFGHVFAADDPLLKMPAILKPAALAVLLDKQESIDTRRYAAEILGKAQATRAVEPLIELLGSLGDRQQVRPLKKAVVRALGRIGDPRAIEPLMPLLDDAHLRIGAAGALGELGATQATARLIELLESGLGWFERKQIIEALGQLEAEQAVPAIRRNIAPRSTAHEINGVIVEALRRIGTKAAFDALKSMMHHEGQSVRSEVASAMRDFDPDLAMPVLRQMARDKDPHVQWAVVRACGDINAPASTDLVRHMVVAGQAQWVREEAVTQLVKRQGKQCATLLRQRYAEETDWSVRKRIIKSLKELDDRDAMPLYLDAAAQTDVEAVGPRVAAFGALVKFGDASTIELLEKHVAQTEAAMKNNDDRRHQSAHQSAQRALASLKRRLAEEADDEGG